jgi:predicted PurR-regulated permease PerM
MATTGIRKINNILLLIIVVLAILYLGAPFLKPLVLGFFFATLMRPVSKLFEGWGMHRMLASVICAIIVLIGVSGLVLLLVVQLTQFSDDLPEMGKQLSGLLETVQEEVASMTGISVDRQMQMLEESEGMAEGIQTFIQNFLQGLMTTLGHFFLTLVYLFLFLNNRSKFQEFILMYVPESEQDKGKKIISRSATVSHHYLWGRLQVVTILAIMYFITFISFDLRFALLFTVVGALLTIIPYIGPLLSGVMPVAFFMVEGADTGTVLLFAGVVLVIQLIESYILEPLIIGKEVSLMPFIIIIAIVIGGMLWGILGMILFVPLFSIMKITFDQINELRPLGFLFGNSESGREYDKRH